MGVGRSGRIVIEMDPDQKRELYDFLGKDGMTLKEWFLKHVESYMAGREQLQLGLSVEADTPTLSGRESANDLPS
jgi:hypothetical protein